MGLPKRSLDLDFNKMAGAILKNSEKVLKISSELNRRTNKNTKWFNEEMEKILTD